MVGLRFGRHNTPQARQIAEHPTGHSCSPYDESSYLMQPCTDGGAGAIRYH